MACTGDAQGLELFPGAHVEQVKRAGIVGLPGLNLGPPRELDFEARSRLVRGGLRLRQTCRRRRGGHTRRAAFAFVAGQLPAHGAVLERDHRIGNAGIAQRLAADDAARASGAVDHHKRIWIGRQLVHPINQFGARYVDAAGNVHTVEFVERARIEDHHLAPGLGEPANLVRRHARRVEVVLDEFAERLGRHVDA